MPRAVVFLLGQAGWLAAAVNFNRDIRPIMADTCFRCHGPDSSSRMAGLRLDQREEALKPTARGARPIVPGKPEESLIVARVFEKRAGLRMPPVSAHKDLSEKQKNLIRQWVAEGASYEEHWAYRPVPPVTPVTPGASIDGYVRQRLAAVGLTLSPEADRRTLLRRVTLDLTGLAPTPEEMAAFAADRSAGAYEKVVDRLLASPRFAERQAQQWLDAVRYADTCGFHGDNAFPAWPYRDWVLKAFRDNKPFDRFTIEQLAGDLLPDATRETRVASAFNRLSRTSAEGGIQPKEYLAKYGADRVRTVANVWMGATLGCAECHDHKFDPLLSRDFYAMKAFFADIDETGLVEDQGVKAWGHQLRVGSEAEEAAFLEVERRVREAKAALEARRASLGDLEEWKKKARAEAGVWEVQKITQVTGTAFERGEKEMIVATGPVPDTATYTATIEPGAGPWVSLLLDIRADESLPGARVARGSDRLVITEIEVRDASGARLSIVRARSDAFLWDGGLTPWNAIDGDAATGWGTANYRFSNGLALALDFATPVDAGPLTVTLRHDSAHRRAITGRFRLALTRSKFAQPTSSGTLAATLPGLPRGNFSENEPALVDATHPELTPLWMAWSKAESARWNRWEKMPRVVASVATEPRETRVLPRGNWMDDSGAVVEPAVPSFFGTLDTGGRRATRLDLARWLVRRENPLTARVYVNRQWKALFGVGLSKVLDDLGSQGEMPSHPELLDHLAASFMDGGWDMKRLIKSVVMSATYRQASVPDALRLAKDPDNRLLSRQNRYRVEAEGVRDIALEVSGLLKERFGGPSVRPYQPRGYLAALNFPKRDYSESHGDDLYRRGLYTFWQRTFLHPSLAAFDAPAREECVIARSASNTPLQALALLNDPTYVEAARVFAGRVMASAKGFDARLDVAFRLALTRVPTVAERAVLRELYSSELARFARSPGAAGELLTVGEAARSATPVSAEAGAWASVARAVLNLHEVITRN